ncbi:MAG: hypothetical protein ABIG46_03025 [Candidatus Omnitrophota bacterium]
MKVDAVIKLGGGLLRKKTVLRSICNELNWLKDQGYKIVIVPGGGELSDCVRRIYEEYKSSEEKAHWMAIRAMDINGMLVSELNNKFTCVTSISDCIKKLQNGLIPIFLSYNLLRKHDILPKSWDVTSDSISLYIAQLIKAKFHILLKDVNGVYINLKNKKLINRIHVTELRTLRRNSCVDKYLPTLLLRFGKYTHVISGLHPARIERVLTGQECRGTIITTKGKA